MRTNRLFLAACALSAACAAPSSTNDSASETASAAVVSSSGSDARVMDAYFASWMGGVNERALRAAIASDIRVELSGLPPITNADAYVRLLTAGPSLLSCLPSRFIQKVYAGAQGNFLYECNTPAGPLPFSETLSVRAGAVALTRGIADLSKLPAAAANKALVDSIYANVFAPHDAHGYDAMLDPAFVIHTAGQDLSRDGFEGLVSSVLTAVPDFEERMHVLEANETGAVAVAMISGTHTGGPLLGVPASGKKIGFTTLHVFRMAGGKIVEDFAEADFASALRQVTAGPGVAPAPTMAEMEAAFARADAEADKGCPAVVSDPVSPEVWSKMKRAVSTGDATALDALYGRHLRASVMDAFEGTAEDAKAHVLFAHGLGAMNLDGLTPRYVGNRFVAAGGRVQLDYLNAGGIPGLPVLTTPKRVSFGEVHALRVCGGRVARQYTSVDTLSMVQQASTP